VAKDCIISFVPCTISLVTFMKEGPNLGQTKEERLRGPIHLLYL
jgi:hypothetical protein